MEVHHLSYPNHLFENETMTHEELKSLIRKEMC